MRRFFAYIFILLGLALILIGIAKTFLASETEIISPLSSLIEKNEIKEDKYSKYTFEALSERKFPPGKITLGKATREEKNFFTYVFTYYSDNKIISGMANIPKGNGPFPVVILLRGYADQKNYHIGLGTERSANSLAENGFLTLAPDFLGYGYSDWEDQDILLARFYRPVEVLSLLASVSSLPTADSSRIGLWAHSNGGQIALSILEITGKPYPTSLWAPVSKGFPESVLVYLGVQEEVGNPVKEKVEEFLKNNDPKKYSISDNFDKIKSSFIIHQAITDELIKPQWTRNLVDKLRSLKLEVNYFEYPKENHNFNRYKTTGEVLRQRDLEFFKKWLGVEL